MFSVLRSLVRKTIGFAFVAGSVAFLASSLLSLPHGKSTAFVAGNITGACVISLIGGYVGTKMMFRGDSPVTLSPAPTTSSR